MDKELDRETLKALSSDTRTAILKELRGKDRTPTSLAGELDRHKSTVVEHLDVLKEAGLVEKNDLEGRRRVEYSLTRKGKKAISSSRLTLVLSASIIGVLGGSASLIYALLTSGQGTMDTLAAQKAAEKMVNASGEGSKTVQVGEPLLFLGSIIVAASVLGLIYWVYNR